MVGEMTATTEELLSKVPLFAGLSKKELRQVASLATRLNLAAGSELTHQGGRGREFIIVLEGVADVVIDGDVVATRGPGDFFGEIALLEARTRVATVLAKTDIEIDVIGHREFSTLLTDFPQIEASLRLAMQERLAENEARNFD
jgi:CRP-like cAMP-binding protein